MDDHLLYSWLFLGAFCLEDFWVECSFQSTFSPYSLISIINELGFSRTLRAFLGSGSRVGGWGVLVEASSVLAGEEGMKPTAVAMAACHS